VGAVALKLVELVELVVQEAVVMPLTQPLVLELLI
jgi:hypothetical protein